MLSAVTGLWLVYERAWPGAFLVLPPVLLVRMGLNAIDGLMAREFNQRTRLGAYLNELTDVASDALLILPFAYVPGIDPLWIGITIVLAIVSEMAGVMGATRRYDGPMGKSDRALVFGTLAVWIGLGLPGLAQIEQWTPSVVSGMIAFTIQNRVRGGLGKNPHA
jgi:CDP-diacylglycerol--glycerol-3-phosphate 3-phosphatidyltransferase